MRTAFAWLVLLLVAAFCTAVFCREPGNRSGWWSHTGAVEVSRPSHSRLTPEPKLVDARIVVEDVRGQPLAGVQVEYHTARWALYQLGYISEGGVHEEDPEMEFHHGTAMTDGNGRFEVWDLAVSEGFGVTCNSAELCQSVEDREVSQGSGQRRIRLFPERQFAICIRDPLGKPLPRIAVSRSAVIERSRFSARTETDANGIARLVGMPDAPRSLYLHRPRGRPDLGSFDWTEGVKCRELPVDDPNLGLPLVEVPWPGGSVASAELLVVARDAVTREELPLVRALAAWCDGPGSRPETMEASLEGGRLRVPRLAAGWIAIEAEIDSYLARDALVHITDPGRPLLLELEAVLPGQIDVELRTVPGARKKDFQLHFLPVGMPAVPLEILDADERTSARRRRARLTTDEGLAIGTANSLLPGRYALECRPMNKALVVQPGCIDISAGENPSLELSLVTGATLRFPFFPAVETSINSGYRLELLDREGQPVRPFDDLHRTLPLGRKARDATTHFGPSVCLPPGSYRLRWNRHPFYGPAPDPTPFAEFELLPGQTLEVELPLPR